MLRRDALHHAAKSALIKDGWTITHDPLTVKFGEQDVYIDLGAEMPFAAEKASGKIAVEVKSFLGDSGITDLERALGQYMLYRSLLRRDEPDRILYLAITEQTYNAVLLSVSGERLVAEEFIKVILFDAPQETILRWIE